ncbi:hypothetical protein SSAG_01087 [Streptomyces sp. Mg1]|nr:hypothetical protein SSAG_01087 [Streptomyces sp. Mg1]
MINPSKLPGPSSAATIGAPVRRPAPAEHDAPRFVGDAWGPWAWIPSSSPPTTASAWSSQLLSEDPAVDSVLCLARRGRRCGL